MFWAIWYTEKGHHTTAVDVVGMGVPTTRDAWVEPLFKITRHGAHDAFSKEDDDAS
jgi:hypothetical protein